MQVAEVRQDGQPVAAAVRQALLAAAERCSQPFEFLQLGGDDMVVAVQLPGQPSRSLPVGQAFFLSGDAPVWCGVRFVNRSAPSHPPAVKQIRQISNHLFCTAMQRESQHASSRLRQLQQQVRAQLRSDDPAARSAAYQTLARLGHADALALLRRRRGCDAAAHPNQAVQQADVETHPQARQALLQALRLAEPDSARRGLARAAANPALPAAVRAGLQARLAALVGATPAAVAA